MPRGRKRLSIEVTLAKLHSLLTDTWKIPENEYVLVDELAYNLQGYEVKGPEMKSGHIDVYVNPLAIPWPDKGERSIIPPKDSLQMEDWANFMKSSGYGLDMLRAKPEFLALPTVGYKLQGGLVVNFMRAFEMTNLFVEQTILHYSLEDVGPDKMKEWINKLSLIKKAALKRGDNKLAEVCDEKITAGKQKWSGIL